MRLTHCHPLPCASPLPLHSLSIPSPICRLIGVSVAQSAASALLAPSLRHVADMLALDWRRRLTGAALVKYLRGNTAYTASQLAGMQVWLHSRAWEHTKHRSAADA